MKARATMKRSKDMPKKSKAMPKKSKAMPKKSKAMPKKSKAMPKKLKAMPKKLKAMPKKSRATAKKRVKRGGVYPDLTVSPVSLPGSEVVASSRREAVQRAMGAASAASEKAIKEADHLKLELVRAYETKKQNLDSMIKSKNIRKLPGPRSIELTPDQKKSLDELHANALKEINKALDGDPTQNDRKALISKYYAPINQRIKDLMDFTTTHTNVVDYYIKFVQDHPGWVASEAYGGPGFSVTHAGRVMDDLVGKFPELKPTIIARFQMGMGLDPNFPSELADMHAVTQERLYAEHHARELHEAQLSHEGE